MDRSMIFGVHFYYKKWLSLYKESLVRIYAISSKLQWLGPAARALELALTPVIVVYTAIINKPQNIINLEYISKLTVAKILLRFSMPTQEYLKDKSICTPWTRSYAVSCEQLSIKSGLWHIRIMLYKLSPSPCKSHGGLQVIASLSTSSTTPSHCNWPWGLTQGWQDYTSTCRHHWSCNLHQGGRPAWEPDELCYGHQGVRTCLTDR